MTRREFVGWMLASVAAMVAGSRIWRLFRRLFEEQRDQLVGVITEIDRAHGTMTIGYPAQNYFLDQHGRPWAASIETRGHYGMSRFKAGEPVVVA